jgi:hypothetical protein
MRLIHCDEFRRPNSQPPRQAALHASDFSKDFNVNDRTALL